MRFTKKTVILAVALLAIISGSVFGTIAYLTDTAEVTNTFTIGKVNITLDETRVNEDGVPVDENGQPAVDENGDPIPGTTPARTDRGNSYPLIPGASYVKDPTMTIVSGSEPAYYRLMVTLNCMDKLLETLGQDFLPQEFVEGWDAAIWPCASIIDNTDNTRTYEFRYAGARTDGGLEPLFTKLNIPTVFDGEDVKALSTNGFEIKVQGNAIQKTGFTADASGKTAEDLAWEAFDAQMAAKAGNGSSGAAGGSENEPMGSGGESKSTPEGGEGTNP